MAIFRTIEAALGLIVALQRKAKVTEEEVRAFMDGSRRIVPTFGKSKATVPQS